MFKNYLTISIRNLIKNKVHSIINITGLAIGLACCILLLLYIQHELNYDRHHERLHQIHRVLRETRLDDGSTMINDRTSGALASALKSDFPEVLQAVRLLQTWGWMEHKDKKFGRRPICLADSEILDVFTYPLIKGDTHTALAKPASVLVTEEAAKRYFGNEDPMGKVLYLYHDITPLRGKEFTITGVLKDLPRTTTFRFEFLMSPPSGFAGQHFWEGWKKDLSWRPVKTFITLPKEYDSAMLEHKLPEFMAHQMGDEVAAKNTYHIQPLSRVHLYSKIDYGIAGSGDITKVQFLSIIALLILMIACVNFVNLTTARSAHRTQEVGIRKAIGAHRLQLAFQFLSESILLVIASSVLALGLVKLTLSEFSDLVNTVLILDGAQLAHFVPHFLALILAVGLSAGAYPALYLSSFNPTEVLKRKPKTSLSGLWLRKGLVVFQFGISAILILSTIVVYSQTDFMSNQDLGFDKEHVVNLTVYNNNSQLRPIAETVKNEFLQHPGVLKATVVMSGIPNPTRFAIRPQGKAEDVQMYTISGDEDLLDVYKIELISGRNITRPGEFLLNESAVKWLGWTDPIDKEIQWVTEDAPAGPVVGVVKDFHFQSFHEPIKPLFMAFCPFPQSLALKLSPENLRETMMFLEEKYEERVGQTFSYRFLDNRIDALYKAEQETGKVLSVFGALALFVACLGLFGLATFAAEMRTKEIGIRKTLGATISDIAVLLSKEFVILVCLANIIAWPIAWYALNKWLANFSYRIDLGLGFFSLAGGLTLVIALLTVSYQTFKASTTNPIDALRNE